MGLKPDKEDYWVEERSDWKPFAAKNKKYHILEAF